MFGRIWRDWNWLDNLALPVLSALMYVAWLVPLVNALLGSGAFSPAGLRLPTWLPLCLLLGGSLLAHLLAALPAGRVLVAICGVIATVGVVVFLLPAPSPSSGPWPRYLWLQATSWGEAMPALWLLAAVTVLLWLRAVSIDWIERSTLYHSFIAGVLAVAVLTAFGVSRYSLDLGIADGLIEPLLVFALCAMLAFALSDISLTQRQSLRVSGSKPRLGQYWFLVVSLVIAGILALAWLTGFILAPDSALWLLRRLGPVLDVLTTILIYIAAAVAYVFFFLLAPLINWLRSLAANGQPEIKPPDQGEFVKQMQEMEQQAQGNSSLLAWIQVAIAVALLALVVIAFALALRRRFIRAANGVLESREVEWSWQLMRGQLRRWFAARKRAARSLFLPLDESEETRAQVRVAYRQLLTRASERGLAHKRGQTPYAYMGMLVAQAPALEQPLATLTAAYQMARYSPEPPTLQTVAAALDALAQVESWLQQYSIGATPTEAKAPDKETSS